MILMTGGTGMVGGGVVRWRIRVRDHAAAFRGKPDHKP